MYADLLFQYFKQTDLSSSEWESLRVDLAADEGWSDESDFRWGDGDFTWTAWAPGHPHPMRGFNCVKLSIASGAKKVIGMNTDDCNYGVEYVCQLANCE